MKLTKEMKQQIVRRVKTETFAERKAAQKVSENEIAKQIRRDLIGNENLIKMESLPQNFFPGEHGVYVTLSGDYHGRTYLSFGELLPVPEFMSNGHYSKLTSEQIKNVQLLNKQQDGIDKDSSELERKINAILSSVNTVKQLLDKWPEANLYFDIPKPTNPPAIPITDLKSMIEKMKK